MRKGRYGRPVIGVVAGWRAYAGTLDSFLGEVFDGIRKAALDVGCDLLLACGVESPGRSSAHGWPIVAAGFDFLPVGPWNTDGLIAVPPLSSPAMSQYCQDLMAQGHPVVFAGPGESGPAVMVDNEGGIHKALRHLVEHGHRRIACIAGNERPPLSDSARRLAAYKSGLQELGLPYEPGLIAYGLRNQAGGREAMQRLLGTGLPFTAVLAPNDVAAQGVVDALSNVGLMVPEDMAVIGFDDRLEARTLVPPLTTVRHPMFEMGYRAVQLLLKYIEGTAQGVETVVIPTQLVIRESCGCLPGARLIGFSQPMPGQSTVTPTQSAGKAPPRPEQEVVDAISAAVSAEIRRLSEGEVAQLCRQLIAALRTSLEKADPLVFRRTMQRILQHVSLRGDDLHVWQIAISILRESLPVLVSSWLVTMAVGQVEAMLDEARVAIGEVVRVQHARHLIRQTAVAEQVGQMTVRFQAARDEAEVYRVLAESLPGIGIGSAVVAFYQAEGGDPVAWSELQPGHGLGEIQSRFLSREFPPRGLYPEDKPFSLALLPLSAESGRPGFVAFDTGNLEYCADIARQLAAALRGVRLYHEAVEGRRLAEEANRLKSRFLSIVSHELRTPLGLITSLSGVLLQESECIDARTCRVKRQDIERIYVGAQHLDSLIRDVLDLARSDVGQLRLIGEPLDLTEVLRAVAVIGEQLARDKGLAWRADIPASLPPVWGDRTRLRQVTLNLINNAVKFTTRGEVSLSATVDRRGVTVTVADTGLGIPPEEQAAIFDEFRQSERTTARGYGGLGLGLSICKRLVEMHGGQIGVRSSGKEGEGSAFHFSLPVMEGQEGARCALGADGETRRVVLLAREAGEADLLREHLTRRGFAAEVHLVGEDGEWLPGLLGVLPDVVLLDLGLTSERGWEILKVLKENPATRNIPVLFHKLADAEGKGSLLELDYLTKPVGSAELAQALISRGLLEPDGCGQAGKRILVVDDEPAVLEMHSRIVEAQAPGYQVLQARDGRQALEVLRRERPDLVLLDLMMPGLDGFGVLEAMREDPAAWSIPVIVLTGQVLTEEDMARLNRSVVSVLQKGLFTVEETLEHVTAALTRRPRSGVEAHRLALQAMAYIHTHYAEPISRADIAAYVGLSERHLARCFQQYIGLPPLTYLNRYRIRQAKVLLEAGGKSITEVAMEVGFSNSNYFSRVFRQEVGVSPRAFVQARGARVPQR